jgi:lysophospholipase L1-like esterase
MKTILCFGDSNTWGYDGRTKGRFPLEVRWTGILRGELGPDFWVVEEGLNGRTTVWDDPVEGEWKNGLRYLVPCLESHKPVDLVILMLGTNDLKARFSVPAADIAGGVERLVSTILLSPYGPQGEAPQLFLVAPPPLGKLTEFAEMFTGATEKSRLLGVYYRQVAEAYGCPFLDLGSLIQSWDVDGVHFAPEMHRKLGLRAAEEVRRILGSS